MVLNSRKENIIKYCITSLIMNHGKLALLLFTIQYHIVIFKHSAVFLSRVFNQWSYKLYKLSDHADLQFKTRLLLHQAKTHTCKEPHHKYRYFLFSCFQFISQNKAEYISFTATQQKLCSHTIFYLIFNSLEYVIILNDADLDNFF